MTHSMHDGQPHEPRDPVDDSFPVREAVIHGRSAKFYSHPRWLRPFHGVRAPGNAPRPVSGARFEAGPGSGARVPVGSESDAASRFSLFERAMQYLPRLRAGEHFSHATALALLECPIRVPVGLPVDVSTPVERGRVRCAGVTGHRHRDDASILALRMPELERAVPLVAPLRAVQQASEQLSFVELVVALDHLLRTNGKHFDRRVAMHRDELVRYAESVSGRGALRFREAVGLARVGAESRMETLMRLAGVRVGMPDLSLQLDVRDGRGRPIGRFDAADEGTRSIFEYDGEQHLCSLRQRRRDARRLQAARDAHWRVFVCYHEDIRDGLLQLGKRMLDFSGGQSLAVRPIVARMLDEEPADATESAIPRNWSTREPGRSSSGRETP